MEKTLYVVYSDSLAVEAEFDVLGAAEVGVLGAHAPFVTESGVETVACCSSGVAMG
ncbi:hypothetical protein [Streptomyces sp. SP18CS02]|uniref:hypothetical protein n=1 Tax=Streptomyces sp. SP18CS02 TaxID=3002531 RepID=UPI002E78413D|nr:hypothetical protein [Streptomyces sp. SP18CS02]MEE1752746.1 hypothetical protein [Streptomyces sp. SP18CS02]